MKIIDRLGERRARKAFRELKAKFDIDAEKYGPVPYECYGCKNADYVSADFKISGGCYSLKNHILLIINRKEHGRLISKELYKYSGKKGWLLVRRMSRKDCVQFFTKNYPNLFKVMLRTEYDGVFTAAFEEIICVDSGDGYFTSMAWYLWGFIPKTHQQELYKVDLLIPTI